MSCRLNCTKQSCWRTGPYANPINTLTGLMLRVADERRLPFEVKAPNATTRKALKELEAGKGRKFSSVDALMANLNADD